VSIEVFGAILHQVVELLYHVIVIRFLEGCFILQVLHLDFRGQYAVLQYLLKIIFKRLSPLELLAISNKNHDVPLVKRFVLVLLQILP